MAQSAIQDHYPEGFRICYGCGTENDHGLRLQTFLEGEETVTRYTPRPFHTAIRGVVYGGLIASVIDCHGTGSAALTMYRTQGRGPGTEPVLRFVTASLHVEYHKPTPLGPELEIRSRPGVIEGRKVTVACKLFASGVHCASGIVVAVLLPERWTPD